MILPDSGLMRLKPEKVKGRLLMPNTLRFLCTAGNDGTRETEPAFLEVPPKVCLPEEEHKLPRLTRAAKKTSCFRNLWCQDALLYSFP